MKDNKMNGLKYIRSQIINKTMDELASDLMVSKQAVYTWESGRKSIPEARLKQISELSGIPEKYFLIEELSEREKLEIKKYRLNKELDDTSVEYEEQVEDKGVIEHMEIKNVENETINVVDSKNVTVNVKGCKFITVNLIGDKFMTLNMEDLEKITINNLNEDT